MSLATVEFDYLRTLVKDHTAIVLDAGKEYLAETRLAPLLGEQKCASVQELLVLLRKQSFNGLHRRVLDAMTNNETWFFRDVNCFAALTGMVLPEMMKRRAEQRRLDIWSAACSSGQEPYSIAMALREQFNLPGWNYSILGTDFCTAILERARGGTVPADGSESWPAGEIADPLLPAAGAALATEARDSLDGAVAIAESR